MLFTVLGAVDTATALFANRDNFSIISLMIAITVFAVLKLCS
jgi:hypothetical protein